MIAIVLAVPVLLWVLIGHVVAPIFVQKVVIRGGAVIQGFAGTIFSAVGASTFAIYGGGMAGAAGWLASMKQNNGGDRYGGRSGDYAPNRASEEFLSEAVGGAAPEAGEPAVQNQPSLFQGGRGQPGVAEGLSGIGTGVMGAGASMINRFGSVARFIGHAVIEGSGEGSGLEYRALAAFGPGGRISRTSNNQANRSSVQARRYIDEA
jgi:hypothetical protein